jgi:hypothetical protein
VKVVLGQEEPEHDRVEARGLLDVGDDRHAAALAQEERRAPQTAVTADSVARNARASTGDWSFGVLGRPGGTTT